MNEWKPTSIHDAFNFQPKSRAGSIRLLQDGRVLILGIELGMEYKSVIQRLSKDYKIDYASSSDKNTIQVDNICINSRATSCMVCFDFNPTTNTLETIYLVSKYATNFCWCFRELSAHTFIEFSEHISQDNKIFWFITEKCKIKISCYSFESSGNTIEKQMVTIVKQGNENINPTKHTKRQRFQRVAFWHIFAIISLIAICIIGYLNANRNRYRPLADDYFMLDTWTGKVYKLDDRVIK